MSIAYISEIALRMNVTSVVRAMVKKECPSLMIVYKSKRQRIKDEPGRSDALSNLNFNL